MASTWRTKASTWRGAAPTNPERSASTASIASRSRPRRASAARRSARSLVAAFPQGEGDGDRVLLDGLVGLLAADTPRTAATSTLVVARNGR